MTPLRSLARAVFICGIDLGAALAMCLAASVLFWGAIHTPGVLDPPVWQRLDVSYARCEPGLSDAVRTTASGPAIRLIEERVEPEQDLLVVSLDMPATLWMPIPPALRDAAAGRGCELRAYQLGPAAIPWDWVAPGALILFQAALAVVLLVRWRSRAALVGAPAANGRTLILAGLAGVALGELALGASRAILPDAPVPRLLETLLAQPYSLLALSVLAIGLAPIVEELFFRRLLFQRFVAAGWPIVGALLTSVAFANAHLWQASDAASAVFVWTVTVLGSLALSVVYLRTHSWRASAVMHATFNTTQVLPLWF